MDAIRRFEIEREQNIRELGHDESLQAMGTEFVDRTAQKRYSYNFSWLGRPIIQYPQDIVAMQEIIWRVQPDLIIETGVAHGGSLILYASILELIGHGEVIGVEIEIREHNRRAIDTHPLHGRIHLLEGSSTDPRMVHEVEAVARGKERVLVTLDSNHAHDHVRRELELYSPLVSRGSYLVVFDTVIEDMSPDSFPDRPWGRGNNPKTAVREFLGTTDRFEIDREMCSKLLVTVAPDGYLRCVKD